MGKTKIQNFWIFLISLMLLTTSACSNPFKVTDPADPKFNPDKFSFNDYKTPEELRDAFRKLFPVGTDREFVDRVLVKAGGAKVDASVLGTGANQFLHVRYTEPYNPLRQFKEAAFHIFIFDKNVKLKNIHLFSGGKLFPDELGRDEFYKFNGGKHE